MDTETITDITLGSELEELLRASFDVLVLAIRNTGFPETTPLQYSDSDEKRWAKWSRFFTFPMVSCRNLAMVVSERPNEPIKYSADCSIDSKAFEDVFFITRKEEFEFTDLIDGVHHLVKVLIEYMPFCPRIPQVIDIPFSTAIFLCWKTNMSITVQDFTLDVPTATKLKHLYQTLNKIAREEFDSLPIRDVLSKYPLEEISYLPKYECRWLDSEDFTPFLARQDFVVLKKITCEYGIALPLVDALDFSKGISVYGFTVQNCRVVELALSSVCLMTKEGDVYANLTELPASIEGLTELKFLHLVGLQLARLPDTLGNLPKLEKIQCVLDNISELPETLGNLKSLRNLTLRMENLRTLPESIGNLTCLEELGVSATRLVIPDSFGDLPSLSKLYISTVETELFASESLTLPESFGNLQNLLVLHIYSSSGYLTLPESLGNLPNLTELYINTSAMSHHKPQDYTPSFFPRTAIVVIPESIGSLSKLKDFRIRDAQNLPETLRNLSNLERLHLECSPRVREPLLPDVFDGLPSLRVLYLEGVKLQTSTLAKIEQREFKELVIRFCTVDGQEISLNIGEIKSAEEVREEILRKFFRKA